MIGFLPLHPRDIAIEEMHPRSLGILILWFDRRAPIRFPGSCGFAMSIWLQSPPEGLEPDCQAVALL